MVNIKNASFLARKFIFYGEALGFLKDNPTDSKTMPDTFEQ